MDKVDQFESAFRAATKAVYHLARPALDKVLLITDLDAAAAEQFAFRIRQFLGVLADAEWARVTGDEYDGVAALLGVIETHKPDLVVTYRHLKSDAWRFPFGLGEYGVVLAQAAGCPVMLLPHPDRGGALEHALHDTDKVMAITDHLTGADDLVNWSVALTREGGTLYLSHVENEAWFERYMAAIGKVPAIDSTQARELIGAQLLKEPADYIRSCMEVLDGAGLPLRVEPVVTMGHRVEEYRKLIEDHAVDLLVMKGRDAGQRSMAGLAYPLAVELRSIPLLLL